MNGTFIFMSVLCIMAGGIFAQTPYNLEVLRSDNRVMQAYTTRISPNGTLYFRQGLDIDPLTFIMDHRAELGLTQDDQFELIRTQPGLEGEIIHRYRQIYRGMPVVGVQYVVHTRNGELVKLKGRVAEGLNLREDFLIHEDSALETALQTVDAQVFDWEIPHRAKAALPDQAMMPTGRRVVTRLPSSPRTAPIYRSAWEFTVKSVQPFGRWEIFVDGETGDLLEKVNLLRSANGHTANGTLRSDHYGHRHLTTTVCGNDFVLNDQMRNLHAKDFNDVVSGSFAAAGEISDDNNSWADNPGPGSLWVIQRAYEYFRQRHGMSGIDDQRQFLPILTGAPPFNTFYDPTAELISFEHGAETVDIGGHEYTHGIIHHTSNLIYARESGALNESFADIFGVLTERFTLGNANWDWLIGEDFLGVGPFRSLEDPNDFAQPDTLGGFLWLNTQFCTPNGLNDFCWVHTNSGVQNHWFYLLVEGGANNGVTVQNIQIERAANIAWRNMTLELFPDADHNDAREGAIDAANAIYGQCSAEVEAVTNAWAAVGVGNQFGNCILPLDVSIQGPQAILAAQPVTWTAQVSGGAQPYAYEWRVNGVIVDTDDTFTDKRGTGDFTLSLTVSSALVAPVTTSIDVRVCAAFNADCLTTGN